MIVYFAKELVSNKILFQGKAIEWEPLEGNRGVARFDDPATIEYLNKVQGTLGVVKITAEQYEAKKKAHPWKPSPPKFWQDEPLKVAGRAYQPPPPKSLAPPAAETSPAAAPPKSLAPPAAETSPAAAPPPAVGEDDIPQRPPDQPDYHNFIPPLKPLSEVGAGAGKT